MLYSLLIGLIGLIPLLGLALGLIYFFFEFHNKRQDIFDRQAKRRKYMTTYNFDQNGNPQYYFDEATGTVFLPQPGNEPFAPTVIIRDATQQRVVAPKSERSINWTYTAGFTPATTTDPQQIEGEVISSEPQLEPKLPNSVAEFENYIAECLDRGVKMTPAATAIGIAAGDNKKYNSFKALWSTVVATKDKGPLS